MKIVFIINNKNNRLAKELPDILEYCREYVSESVKFLYTEREKHAIELAKKAAESRCDYLVAVGGDGTLNEVVNGVLQSEVPAKNYPAIGLLPYGSANDFARTAQLSNSVEELMNLISTNTTRMIDAGKIMLTSSDETRYFINITGIGLGPEVVKSLEASSGILSPGLSYFKHIIKGFLKYRKKEVSVTGGSWQWQGKLLQMAVANGKYYGHAICTAPDASLNDGQFQVAIFGNLSVWDYLKNMGNLKKGIKIRHHEVSYFESNKVHIKSSSPCGIEADGEFVGLVPATITILPKAIRFLMPKD